MIYLKNSTETIGQRIKRLRQANGWSQEELGRKINLRRAAINKIETGTTANLKQSHIIGLAEAFQISPIEIMGWDINESSPFTHQLEPLPPIYKEPSLLNLNLEDELGEEGIACIYNLLHLNKIARVRIYQYTKDLLDTNNYLK